MDIRWSVTLPPVVLRILSKTRKGWRVRIGWDKLTDTFNPEIKWHYSGPSIPKRLISFFALISFRTTNCSEHRWSVTLATRPDSPRCFRHPEKQRFGTDINIRHLGKYLSGTKRSAVSREIPYPHHTRDPPISRFRENTIWVPHGYPLIFCTESTKVLEFVSVTDSAIGVVEYKLTVFRLGHWCNGWKFWDIAIFLYQHGYRPNRPWSCTWTTQRTKGCLTKSWNTISM